MYNKVTRACRRAVFATATTATAPKRSLHLSHTSFARRISEVYDLCILGCGPAGFAAAMRSQDFHKSVCVVNKGRLGGAGLHNGALSSKTMWEMSNDYTKALSSKRGFLKAQVSLSYTTMLGEVERAISSKEAQLQGSLEQLHIPLYNGFGKFISPNEVLIQPDDGSEELIVSANNFLIATGSRPRAHPKIEADGKVIHTSDTIQLPEKLPKSLVILGAGVVGCEYATIFANLRETKVYLIDKAKRILPAEDDDVSSAVSRRMEEKGVTIHHNAVLKYMKKTEDDKVEYMIEHPGEQETETITVDAALLSIGRVPNLDGMGLQEIGLKFDEQGGLVTTKCQTTVPHIWAAGDSTIDVALVNIAENEGRYVVERLFSKCTPRDLSYNTMSTIMFLDPSVASSGLNETQLQRKKIPYRVATIYYGLVSRAIAKGGGQGFVKLIVSHDDTMTILGIRAMGAHASSIVDIASLMIKLKSPVCDLTDLLVAYPAMTEGLQECARVLLGQSIHKPVVFPQFTRTAWVTYDEQGKPVIGAPSFPE